MELTKSKLHKILKKYRKKLEDYNKEWEDFCNKKTGSISKDGEKMMVLPSIYDHEKHNSKGAQLFKDLMQEFEGFDVFEKKSNLN